MSEDIDYFFAELDYHLKNGVTPEEALKLTIKDYAHVVHDIASPPTKEELKSALKESLKLQSHYAKLLNMHDGGERIGFASIEAWLRELKNSNKQIHWTANCAASDQGVRHIKEKK